MDKKDAIEKVKLYKRLLTDYISFDKIYIYGSYAKNTFRNDSDIDVAIVVDQIDGDFFSINPLLWKLRREIDDRIEPILIEKKHDVAGFLEKIQDEGIEIS
ncbi:MAG: nucleotidyltransferase domain-containing protein [Prolixibacteraceae bacterium]|jgi:predicted nucleotidyltransferase|nr:nucleotidyltransferase domain-containing protein [Prolixibacteraceae bacterium]